MIIVRAGAMLFEFAYDAHQTLANKHISMYFFRTRAKPMGLLLLLILFQKV